MDNQQYENAMKLAMNAFAANNEQEAVSFFNQALTIFPESPAANVGKGCAVLISFSLANAESDAVQAYKIWENAKGLQGFGDKERDMIADAAIGFCSNWFSAATSHFNKFKDTDNAKNEYNRVKEAIKIYLGNIYEGIPGMDEHISFVEGYSGLIQKTMGILGGSFDSTRQRLDERLFLLKNKYRKSIEQAVDILPKRDDYDGVCRVEYSSNKMVIKGKIDIQNGKTKFNDIKIIFTSKSVSEILFTISFDNTFKLRNPDAVESELGGQLKKWKMTRIKEKIQFSIEESLANDELAGRISDIQKIIDECVSEGKRIVDSIEKNGGVKGLFG